MRLRSRHIALLGLATVISASLFMARGRTWRAELFGHESSQKVDPAVNADGPSADQPKPAKTEVSNKRAAVEKLVQEFQDKVRHESTSSIDQYVFMMPLEQALRDDAETFAAYQEYVYERLVNAEKPFDALEDAMLFPIVAYVDQSAAEKILMRAIQDTQGDDQKEINAGYVQMLGDWMVSEEAVETLLGMGDQGLIGLSRALETLGQDKSALRSKIVAGVQDKLAYLQRQGQEHSQLAGQYQKLLERSAK